MVIQYCSDLHLEFRDNQRYVLRNPLPPVGDVLILAGDIVLFSLLDKQKAFFDYVSQHFAITYWIAGNHEYYDNDISERSGSVCEKIRHNVLLVNNQSFVHGTTRFVLSTLWSNINTLNGWRIENSVSDFHAIHFKGERFTVETFNNLHENDLSFIRTELEKDWTGTTVVVTHHVPTFMHYPKKYKDDPINEVFASEQTDLIMTTAPAYWIYGHHHTNTPPFTIGSTRMLTNQLGYVHHHEHGAFDSGKHIVV